MFEDPLDMFDEMDGLFARLFDRMDREFMAGGPQVSGFRFVARHDGMDEGSSLIPAPVPGAAREPVAEVHRMGDETRVVVGLPGITAEAIRLDVHDRTLVIDAGDAEHHYRTTADLPPVDPASMQRSFRNGVLEVSFRNLPGADDEPGAGTS